MSLVPAFIAVFGVLVGIVVGYVQWKRNRELELEKLVWEREKLQLTQQLERERAAEDLDRERARQLEAAEETERASRRATRRSSTTDSELAQQYRYALATELRNMKILDMSRPLDLQKIYVQMTICEEPPHFAHEQEIRQLAEGDSRDRVLRAARRPVVTIQPDEGLRKHRRIVVLGDPGSGKTTMLRHLAMRTAQAQLHGTTVFPVYIELRHFVDSGMTDIVSYTAARLGDDYGFDSAGPYIEGRFIAGDSVLLLDGLDEVLGGASAQKAADTYKRIVNEINRVAIRYPNLPIAVTCRRAGWIPSLTSFVTLEVVDFTWDQICAFIANWFETQPDKARQLQQTLSGNLRMQTLATNPLILSLIAIVFERDLELPERRAELYKRCAEVMLREWDAHRGIRRFSKFTTDRKRDLLQEVAWHFHSAGKRYFPKQELVRLISDYLPSIGIATEEGEEILAEITTQYGLLKEQAHGWYGFLHLTMQEYFAAVAVSNRSEERVDFVVRHRHDPWWEEVLLLLAGQLPDATDMLLGILEISPRNRTYNPARDDVFGSDLLLAARCLIGSPRIEMTSLRSEILNQVQSLLLNAPSSFHRKRAATALAEVGTEESTARIYAVATDKLTAESVRSAAAHGLCKISSPSAARQIGQMLTEGPARHGKMVIRSILQGIAQNSSLVNPQRLLDLLNEAGYRSLRGSIYRAMGNIGNSIFTPALIGALNSAMKSKKDDSLFDLISAIVHLNAREAIPYLYKLVESERLTELAVSAIAELGRNEDAERILRLLDTENSPNVRFSAGSALVNFDFDILLEPAINRLIDPAVEWRAKWLIAAALDTGGSGYERVEQLYENAGMEQEVRVALAALIAPQTRFDLRPVLRNAIRNRVVPPSLMITDEKGRGTGYTGMCWTWICTTLRSLQDDSIVADLIDIFEQELSELNNPEDLEGIICAAASLKSDAFAHALLRNIDKLIDPDSRNSLRWAASAMTRATAANFTKIVFDRANLESGDAWLVRNIGFFMAEIAEDHETAAILHDAAKDPIYSEHASEIYEAVHEICQRGRFRLFSDSSTKSISKVV